MARLSVLYSLAIIASVCAVPGAKALVFHPDDRISVRPLPGTTYSPIGLVYDQQLAARATGFLISDCEVLTVKHMFLGDAPIVGRSAYFFAGVIGAKQNSDASEAKVIAVGPAIPGKANRPVSPGDWAIMRLRKCLGKTYGSALLVAQPPATEETVQMAGYPVDRGLDKGLTVDPSCRLRETFDDMLFHDCAAQPGNSGSPIFRVVTREGKTRLEVIAMGSGAFSYGVPGATLKLPVTQYYTAYANSAVPAATILAHRNRSISGEASRQMAARSD